MTSITVLEPHPLAELIPPMSDDEFTGLRDDIEVNGQRDPITIHEDRVLDGRHRARACEELGRAPLTRDYDGEEPAGFVVSMNLQRRNLTISQRTTLAAQFLPALEAEAKRRMARPGDPRRGAHAPGETVSSALKRQANGRATDQAAVIFGVSGASVRRAKRVMVEDPEAFEEIKAGRLSVTTAEQRIKSEKKQPPPSPPPFEGTKRQREIAGANKRRIETVIGTCQGYARGLHDLKAEWASQIAEPDEIAGWIDCLHKGEKALRDLRKRLEGGS